MAIINRIEGLLSSQLMGQVAETTRPQPAKPPHRSVRENQTPSSPRGRAEDPARSDLIARQNRDQLAEQADRAVRQLQETLDKYSADHHQVGFRQDPDTDQVIIEIRDREGELVKQFPPEKILNLQRHLDDLAGMVIDRMT